MTTIRRLALITASGGAGGMVNAALCFAEWPVRVPESSAAFRWHAIPAGFAHGGLLALIAAAAVIGAPRRGWRRAITALLVGWVAGYLSYVPLDLSVFTGSLTHAALWPVDSVWEALWRPYFQFGIVAALLYLWLALRRESSGVLSNVAASYGAGAVGSIWWWAAWGPWYFCLLHGAIWGVCVGCAIWRANPRAA